ncbi:MAG: ribonucleoside-diphosphate reductase subunit alpha [Francisellaceae bacterium]|jgi:ribonucleoside-diphosphate reductase alpha chain|nr:ribonucleoside-diphosphate reductase subunit alpha [Francisellaceae bacterium]MBT6539863.1 ribonucleoside-diphosphate reductase subunit alpha [Francisellaceae bacterium]
MHTDIESSARDTQRAAVKTSPEDLDVSNLKVIKRGGALITFNETKIKVALTQAFLDTEGDNAALSNRVHGIVNDLTDEVLIGLRRYLHTGGHVQVEEIQDQVELVLMRNEFRKVARSYILYREEHKKLREDHPQNTKKESVINITMEDGSIKPLDIDAITNIVNEACADLEEVTSDSIIKDTLKNLFDKVHIKDVRKTLIMSARTLIETEPNYSYVTTRLLLNDIHIEVAKTLELPAPKNNSEMKQLYPSFLSSSISKGIEVGLLDPRMQNFDLDRLGKAIVPKRDFLFSYLGLQTLYDRYFLHNDLNRFELSQTFFMRVAMGLAIEEDDKNSRAIEFYNLMSTFDYMSSTPTLFNSGTVRSQLSSCFLTTIPDDLSSIYNAIKDNALLSKFAGGLGNDWTHVRAMNAQIKGTNGKSQGVVPFLKVANDTAVAVNQGGKRKGAVCAYLENWHLDIEEFLELRKNTGDDRRRTHDMNTAIWVPDLFMKRVLEDRDWTLFSPDDTPDLHDLFGDAFEKAYEGYESIAEQGKINNFKTIPAKSLWRKMLSMLFETGHPWITFKDTCNIRSPQQHTGVIHSSNLCTEITLNTSADEIAVCNLGSVNLSQHVTAKGLDTEKLKKTINTAIRMLDNVIDINYYSVIQARRSNLKHRPIGLGVMGFQDSLYKLNISYSSEEAVEFADRSMEHISYYAIEASSNLAKERGTYASFEGSLWSKGILPIDSINRLQEYRGLYLEQDRSQSLDWETLREKVKTVGMRNSNTMAIAPTATISNICGVSQSIEPTYQNLFVKSNLSGEFTVVNKYLVRDLKKLGLWDSVMVNDLKYFNGSVRKIERIPEELREKYASAFEIDPKWLIDSASRRQKWIDQAQSLNLYIAQPSGKQLDVIYRTAWLRGLKTTYYLRSLGATDTEKSTVNRGTLNAVESTPSNICPIDDPSCESCQ